HGTAGAGGGVRSGPARRRARPRRGRALAGPDAFGIRHSTFRLFFFNSLLTHRQWVAGMTIRAPALPSPGGAEIDPPWALSTRRAIARLRPEPPRHSSNTGSSPAFA